MEVWKKYLSCSSCLRDYNLYTLHPEEFWDCMSRGELPAGFFLACSFADDVDSHPYQFDVFAVVLVLCVKFNILGRGLHVPCRHKARKHKFSILLGWEQTSFIIWASA